jgi:hypothetical protein
MIYAIFLAKKNLHSTYIIHYRAYLTYEYVRGSGDDLTYASIGVLGTFSRTYLEYFYLGYVVDLLLIFDLKPLWDTPSQLSGVDCSELIRIRKLILT